MNRLKNRWANRALLCGLLTAITFYTSLRRYLPQSLFSLQLADIPGIGKRMEQRLLAEGVTTMRQLCALTRERMHSIWGGV